MRATQQLMADIDAHREMARSLIEERRRGTWRGCGEVAPGIVHRWVGDCIAYERGVIERMLRAYWAQRDAEGWR